MPEPREKSTSFLSSLLSPPPRKFAPPPAPASRKPVAGPAQKFVAPPPAAPESAAPAPPHTATGLTASAYPHPQATPPMWRDELTGRIQKFRSKRARLQGNFDPNSSLDLDFDAQDAETEELASLIGGQVVNFRDTGGEFDSEPEGRVVEDAALDSVPQSPQRDGLSELSNAAVQAGEIPLSHSYATRDPVEIILDSEPSTAPGWAQAPSASQHLMSRRLNAGLVDAGILLVGGGIFGAIFWAFGLGSAQISASPLNLMAMGVVAAALAIFYFGLTVMLSGATPGLAWMGLEVRNLDGGPPTTKEAWGRAVCYLVSASALFLGFLWAFFDSDSLTWHDLMSGTCIVEQNRK